jgi:hypothetical protein
VVTLLLQRVQEWSVEMLCDIFDKTKNREQRTVGSELMGDGCRFASVLRSSAAIDARGLALVTLSLFIGMLMENIGRLTYIPR